VTVRLQAKDIADDDFQDAIERVCTIRGFHGFGASRWDVAAVLAGDDKRVIDTARAAETPGARGPMFADYETFPDKLVLAKARKLIRRGVIDGCVCGCRGDFVPMTRVKERGW
jgi:hypothetical protein